MEIMQVCLLYFFIGFAPLPFLVAPSPSTIHNIHTLPETFLAKKNIFIRQECQILFILMKSSKVIKINLLLFNAPRAPAYHTMGHGWNVEFVGSVLLPRRRRHRSHNYCCGWFYFAQTVTFHSLPRLPYSQLHWAYHNMFNDFDDRIYCDEHVMYNTSMLAETHTTLVHQMNRCFSCSFDLFLSPSAPFTAHAASPRGLPVAVTSCHSLQLAHQLDKDGTRLIEILAFPNPDLKRLCRFPCFVFLCTSWMRFNFDYP